MLTKKELYFSIALLSMAYGGFLALKNTEFIEKEIERWFLWLPLFVWILITRIVCYLRMSGREVSIEVQKRFALKTLLFLVGVAVVASLTNLV